MARSRMSRGVVVMMLALLSSMLGSPASGATDGGQSSSWKDVPPKHWARAAVDFVAGDHTWMQDYGSALFRPNAEESRKYLARAIVIAFAQTEPIDPLTRFDDLPATDAFYRFANVAVKLHWIEADGDHFLPDQPVTMTEVHRALVMAVGLGDVAAGFDRIHTTDGYVFRHQRDLGVLEIGMQLGLRYNHDDESLDVQPDEALPRSEVAWSLYRAAIATTTESWRIRALATGGFARIHLGPLSPAMRKVVEFGMRYVGYPYIYAGEWPQPTPTGYCCGAQPQGGFDCSGLTWWLMKAPSGTYDNSALRGYRGWTLQERSSRDMAATGKKLTYAEARAGDLLFYDGDDDGVVDHVDVYIGYGWALDSSNGVGGVTVLRVKTGWYQDHFVHARRIVKV
ncbi:MAG: C40 family peptidase [Actinomycetota bacterium]